MHGKPIMLVSTCSERDVRKTWFSYIRICLRRTDGHLKRHTNINSSVGHTHKLTQRKMVEW